MATKRQRYIMTINDRLLAGIEEFQKDYHFSTRSSAIQELIRIGLETVKTEEAAKKQDGK